MTSLIWLSPRRADLIPSGAMVCEHCAARVDRDGVVVRSIDIDQFAPGLRSAGAAVLCGQTCLEQVRAASTTLVESVPIAEYLTQLVQSVGVEQYVADALDLAALGRFRRAVGS